MTLPPIKKKNLMVFKELSVQAPGRLYFGWGGGNFPFPPYFEFSSIKFRLEFTVLLLPENYHIHIFCFIVGRTMPESAL